MRKRSLCLRGEVPWSSSTKDSACRRRRRKPAVSLARNRWHWQQRPRPPDARPRRATSCAGRVVRLQQSLVPDGVRGAWKRRSRGRSQAAARGHRRSRRVTIGQAQGARLTAEHGIRSARRSWADREVRVFESASSYSARGREPPRTPRVARRMSAVSWLKEMYGVGRRERFQSLVRH